MSESDSDSFHSVKDDEDESWTKRDTDLTDELHHAQLAAQVSAKEMRVAEAHVRRPADNETKSRLLSRAQTDTNARAVSLPDATEGTLDSNTGWDDADLSEGEIGEAGLAEPEVRKIKTRNVTLAKYEEVSTEELARDKLTKETDFGKHFVDDLGQSATGWEDGWDVEEIEDEHLEAAVTHSAPSRPEAAVKKFEPENSHDLNDASQKVQQSQEALTPSREAGPQTQTDNRWGNWGTWGSSLLSTATSSVSTLTSQVGQGINNVFETVEQTLGAPKPEDLALKQKTEKEVEATQEGNPSDKTTQQSGSEYDIKGLLSTISNKVQTSGVTLVATGLDALEGLGKKTMEVVGDKDPGLRQTKAVLTGKLNQPNLSQVLREATSTEHATGDKHWQSSSKTDDSVSFVKYFEEEQGAGSWEALEMLSSTCQQQVESPDIASARSMKRSFLDRLEALCQMDDEEDFPQDEDPTDSIRQNYNKMKIGLPEPHALLHLYSSSNDFLQGNSSPGKLSVDIWRKTVHKHGIRTLAACTAKSLEQLRKMTEMVFLSSQSAKSDDLLLMRVGVMYSIICEFCGQLDRIASAHASCLTVAQDKSENKSQTSSEVTDMFVEASNSTRYIQDAFKLCLPVFQLAVLQDSPKPSARKGKKSD